MVRIACVLAIMIAVHWRLVETPSSAETAPSDHFANLFDHWPLDYQCPGNVIAGETPDLAVLRSSLSNQEKSGCVGIVLDRDVPKSVWRELLEIFEPAIEVRLVRCKPGDQLDHISELSQACNTLVWWSNKEAAKSLLDSLPTYRESLNLFLSQRKTLILLGQPASFSGDYFYVAADDDSTDDEPRLVPGMGALPGTLIEFAEDPSISETIVQALSKLPGTVGITANTETLIGRRGRIVFPLGEDAAMDLHLPKGSDQKAVSMRYPRNIAGGNRVRQGKANEYLADLTQWRRRAIDLHLPLFPAVKPPQPIVPNGTLVIVGGGGTPQGLMQQFIDFAGGADSAKLIYVPCTEQERVSPNQSTIRQWKRMGVKNAAVLHTKDRQQADSDEAFLAILKDATGIWFGGGRQWNFADSYYGTRTQTMMQEVLKRGGAIGGSSAGASIQADFLARATPIENFDIIAPGYLRGGMGFLPGVAIDQHFTQRGRQPDMSELIATYPQVLGIGIDESTAIIVQKSQARVVGQGDVYFYDAEAVEKEGYLRLSAGECYDLVERNKCEAE